ncbi:MAG: cobalamin biosynthesis protein, partial [Marmoricola sp.]|nr:cobalamin biosynthesis protein [Marmoricola sp.]
MRTRALGLLLGALADRLVPDPARGHPVALFGAVAARLERRLHGHSRARGAAYVVVLVGGTSVVGLAVERLSRRHPLTHVAATALATWAVLGGASL